jgi:glyoxylase-like metal-dependent hydrolase (beta-lactamase superfamily II)
MVERGVVRVHPLWMGMSYAYLVETEGGLLLVDSGLVRWEYRVLRKMRALGRDDLRCIYLTHAHLDHSGSAAAVRRATGAPIVVHEADAVSLRSGVSDLGEPRLAGRFIKRMLPLVELFLKPEPCEPDATVTDGDTLAAFGLDATVLHTPGHTPGSTTLLVPSAAGESHAFVGDLITADRPIPDLQRQYATDWGALIPSLARVQAAAPDYVYVGHGRQIPVEGARLAEVDDLRVSEVTQ